MSIQETDAAAENVAVAPRVRLEVIEAKIAARYDLTANEMIDGSQSTPRHEALNTISVCMVVMANGFVVIGKSAPAAPENFNRELGKRFAYEDVIRQLWPLEGYALREKQA